MQGATLGTCPCAPALQTPAMGLLGPPSLPPSLCLSVSETRRLSSGPGLPKLPRAGQPEHPGPELGVTDPERAPDLGRSREEARRGASGQQVSERLRPRAGQGTAQACGGGLELGPSLESSCLGEQVRDQAGIK